MKRATLFLLIALVVPAFAQQQTLFDGALESGGYGGPSVKVSTLRSETGVFVGGYGGWLINHQLMLGGGGYGLVTDHGASDEAMQYYGFTRRMSLDVSYGGGVIEYIIAPNNLVHGYVSVLVGAGNVSYREQMMNWDDSHNGRDYDAFFVVEPSVNLELNITTWMRLGLGAGYRYVSGVSDLRGITDNDLRGVWGGLTLKFGTF